MERVGEGELGDNRGALGDGGQTPAWLRVASSEWVEGVDAWFGQEKQGRQRLESHL